MWEFKGLFQGLKVERLQRERFVRGETDVSNESEGLKNKEKGRRKGTRGMNKRGSLKNSM